MSLKDDLELNKPRRTPGHATSSHVVKTNVDGKPKMIRFGEQGANTAGAPSPNDSEKTKAKRKAFKDRHAKNIARGPASAAYWANKEKWAEGGPVGIGGPLEIAKDVLRDTASGIASPIISSAGWLMDRYLTDYTPEERDARYERLSEATNYTPKTGGGQYINETAMKTIGDLVNKGMEFYGGRTHMLTPEVRQTASTINQAYQDLEPDTKEQIGHWSTLGELIVPVAGKMASTAIKAGKGYDGPMDLAEMAAKYEQDGPTSGEMQANTDAVQQRLIDAGLPAPMMQVKEPGGNWPNVSGYGLNSPESVIENLIDTTFMDYEGNSLNKPGEALVSGWLRSKGKKYITKEIGTGQGDSLVQMFDNYELDAFDDDNGFGIAPTVHLDPALNLRMFEGLARSAVVRSVDRGRPITSENPLAQRYERLSDKEIKTTTLDDLTPVEREKLNANQPFYATAPGNTVVHFLKNDNMGTRLGLDIIADELNNMVDPDNLSGLPAEFLLSENNLNKLTLEQASRKVGEARVWRVAENKRIELEKFTESLNVSYEDPEFVNKSAAKKKDRPAPGMKWVVIDDVSDDLSMNSCNIIGEEGGWCTGQKGYAEEYTEGGKFIAAALDNNNQPQAQISLKHVQDTNGEFSGITDSWVTDILEVAPPGNKLDSDRVLNRVKRDPEYLNKVLTGTAKYLNNLNDTEYLGVVKLDGYGGGVHGGIADIKLLSAGDSIPNSGDLNLRVRSNSSVASMASPSLSKMLSDVYMGEDNFVLRRDFISNVVQLLGRPQRVGQELPRFMTKNDVIEFIQENGDETVKKGLKRNANAEVFVEQITSMREELRALTANMRAGPVLADLMSMNPTDLLATRTAMRQQLDRELNRFAENDRGPTGIYTEAEVERYTSLLDNRRAQLIEEINDLQSDNDSSFTQNEIAGMDLSVLSELAEERLRYANQRMDAQIDADGLLDAQIDADGILDNPNHDPDTDEYMLAGMEAQQVDLDTDEGMIADVERQSDLINELRRLQESRPDIEFAYTENEMRNLSYNDIRETIDQYNEFPSPDALEAIRRGDTPEDGGAIPVDRTLAEYRELAFAPSGTVSGFDRLDGFHAMLQTSGWDETGEIRVNLRDPQMNEGIWPDGKENLLVEAKEVMEDYQLGSRTIDETMDDLFLIASDRDREFIVNNYSDIKLMIMGDDFMTAADYNINNFARGGSVTYNPDEIRRLSENLLAGNYYEGGSVTYNPKQISKLSKQLMETYNV